MNKNFKYLALIFLPILTIVVWIVWRLLFPAHQHAFLEKAGRLVENVFLPEKKRRSKGLRVYAAKAGRK